MSANNQLRDKAKSLWIKGMKAIGNTAANIANNTRYKVDEVTIQNRRREVLKDLAEKTYSLWMKGEQFPEAMEKMLIELKQLDEQLNDMRAEKYAMANKTAPAPEAEGSEFTEQAEEDDPEEEDPAVLPAEDSPVSLQINELFDDVSSVGKAAEKVNAGLKQMSGKIRQFDVQETEAAEESGKEKK